MKRRFLLLFAFALALVSCKDKYADLSDGLYAEINTSKGTIMVDLNYDKAPVTVANFVSLAEGKNPYVAQQFRGRPFYDGLKFHRVIADFMIQGGDPLGNGTGDAGYKFKDEISTDLKHDSAGTLSMANSGPGTNSSQFFITHKATPWLDGKHTIFGHVIGNGMETVNKIVQDDAITSIKIIRKGEAAKKFDAVKIFSAYYKNEIEKFDPVIRQKAAYFQQMKSKATKTASGLSYIIVSEGTKTKPEEGKDIFIHYAGYFEDGKLFDTSIADVAKEFGKFNEERAQQGGYRPMPFQFGRRQGMIPGFIEGLDLVHFGDKAIIFIPSQLGYGEAGAGGVIPPNADLIFEIEIFDKMPNN